MLWAYRKTRDTLHPLMYLGPLLLFVYFIQPINLYYRDLLEEYFPDQSRLEFVQLIYIAGVTALCAGCLRSHGIRRRPTWRRHYLRMTPVVRRQLYRIGVTLGTLGLLAFIYMVNRAGGFRTAFSVMKGGGVAPSGYIGEAPMLTFPAIILLLLSWQGQRRSMKKVLLILLFASPFLLYGSLGGRRGPLFMTVGILLLPWWFISRRRPSLRSVAAALCLLAIGVLFVWSQRGKLYIGSDFDFDTSATVQKVFPEEADAGNEYIFGAGQVLNASYHNRYYWGRRLFVTFFVRPIPRQIWPTKYEDMGMPQFAKGHSSFEDAAMWKESLGWAPLAGAAHGLVADMFLEFSWAGIVACYFIGYFFSYIWERASVEGGMWTLIYVEASILSIYLPAQSLSAWLYRFMFMMVPTVLLWRHFIGPWQQKHRKELALRESARQAAAAAKAGEDKPCVRP
jgi:oligosaccharide repeat unit polymerase